MIISLVLLVVELILLGFSKPLLFSLWNFLWIFPLEIVLWIVLEIVILGIFKAFAMAITKRKYEKR